MVFGHVQLLAQSSTPSPDTSDQHRQIEALIKKLKGITITGFMEPEFQVGQSKGENTFSGGNFSTNSSSRFIIRRGRIRTSYTALDKNSLPVVDMCFELEGTQKGININEFWSRIYENKWQLFSFTTGMLPRPFGNEITYSTRLYESPERGRMSQTLMRGEVDLGAMISFEPRKKDNPLRYLKASIGYFNGQGLTGPAEFDSFKDLISRISLKSYPLSKRLFLSGGVSFFKGGIEQNSRYIYRALETGGVKINTVDSSFSNLGKKAPRNYYGADLQLKYTHKNGTTEIRAEYWQGKQTGSLGSSETPGALLQEPYAIRNFNGAFFYLLHNLAPKHQLCVKYDIYDPNTDIKKTEIGRAGTNFSAADIKYSTLGFGYIYYWNANLKLMLWYDLIYNESTQLTGYKTDVKDNVFTCRLQFRF
jgi:hypothetical protein